MVVLGGVAISYERGTPVPVGVYLVRRLSPAPALGMQVRFPARTELLKRV